MALLKSGRMVLIGILVILGLLVASCGTTSGPDDTPTTRDAGDTLGLDGGITTLGKTDPIGVIGLARIGTQQEEEVNTGTLFPQKPVNVSFDDQPNLAEQIDIEQVVRWRQPIGFAETVTVTAPEGTDLPRVITYQEARFGATLRDERLDREVDLEIGSDEGETIVLVFQSQEGNTYTYAFREEEGDIDNREFTTIRVEGEDVRTLFEILTTGSDTNGIVFRVELDYEIDGNSSIPEDAEFEFTFVTEPNGVFEIEVNREEDIR